MDKNKNNPVAVETLPDQCEAKTEQDARRQRFWQTVDRIRERNADKDPDEELAFITEVVEEVRREQYAREQSDQNGR